LTNFLFIFIFCTKIIELCRTFPDKLEQIRVNLGQKNLKRKTSATRQS